LYIYIFSFLHMCCISHTSQSFLFVHPNNIE
jgi:hypothetical protein